MEILIEYEDWDYSELMFTLSRQRQHYNKCWLMESSICSLKLLFDVSLVCQCKSAKKYEYCISLSENTLTLIVISKSVLSAFILSPLPATFFHSLTSIHISLELISYFFSALGPQLTHFYFLRVFYALEMCAIFIWVIKQYPIMWNFMFSKCSKFLFY